MEVDYHISKSENGNWVVIVWYDNQPGMKEVFKTKDEMIEWLIDDTEEENENE